MLMKDEIYLKLNLGLPPELKPWQLILKLRDLVTFLDREMPEAENHQLVLEAETEL